MARRLCLVLGLFAAAAVSSSDAFPNCPRGLHAVLDSPACSGHRLHMIHAPRTTIDAASVGDVCVDSLRVLLTLAESMPCGATVASAPTTGSPEARRLSSEDGPFKGKLNCTFDKAASLNMSDLTQSFIIDCKEITKPGNYLWLYITLGDLGTPTVLWCVIVFGGSEIKSCLAKRRERRRQQAIDRAEAKPVGLAYALA